MQDPNPSDPDTSHAGEQPTKPETPAASAADASVSQGRRIAAGVIDAFILTLVWMLLSAVSGDMATQDTSVRFNLNGWWLVLFLSTLFGYHFVLEAAFGASIGKWLLGVRVADVSGAPAKPRALFLRNVLRFVDVLPFYYLMGIVAVAASKRRQRLGDMAAGTIVVRKAA